MNNAFDKGTVTAIITGTILLILTNSLVWVSPDIDDKWAIHICAVVLVLIASISGTLAGFLIPVASCVFTGIVFKRPDAFLQMTLLLVTGVSMGHYCEKLGVGHGRFKGIYLFDFSMIVTCASLIAWVCIRPLAVLYVYGRDLRVSIPEGLSEGFISIAVKLVICLPVLIVLNHFFKKKQMVEDAKREYLYHVGK